MTFYLEEEEVWKCPKHPSKRRRNGICPVCLKDRLVILCPDCAKSRPCDCCAAASSSSSASSSFSLSSRGEFSRAANGEPDLRRSRSVGITYLQPRHALSGSGRWNPTEIRKSRTPSLLSIIWPSSRSKSMREPEDKEIGYRDEKIAEFSRMMMRSRSVSVAMASGSDDCNKGRRWHFPGPMKIFRQSKAVKVVGLRDPLCKG